MTATTAPDFAALKAAAEDSLAAYEEAQAHVRHVERTVPAQGDDVPQEWTEAWDASNAAHARMRRTEHQLREARWRDALAAWRPLEDAAEAAWGKVARVVDLLTSGVRGRSPYFDQLHMLTEQAKAASADAERAYREVRRWEHR